MSISDCKVSAGNTSKKNSIGFQVPSGEGQKAHKDGQNEHSGGEERRGERAERRGGECAGERRRDELHEREGHLRAAHNGAGRRLVALGLRVGLLHVGASFGAGRGLLVRLRSFAQHQSALVDDELRAESDAQRVREGERGLQRHEAVERRTQERAQEADGVQQQSEAQRAFIAAKEVHQPT